MTSPALARDYARHDDGAAEHDERDRLRDERAATRCLPCDAECCERGVRITRDEHGRESEQGWCPACDGSGYRPPMYGLRLVELDPDTLEPLSGEDIDDDCPF